MRKLVDAAAFLAVTFMMAASASTIGVVAGVMVYGAWRLR